MRPTWPVADESPRDEHGPPPRRNLLATAGGNLARSKYALLLLGLGLVLLLGLARLQDYGTSVDEWHNAFYGELFLRTYETGSLLRSPQIDYFNGPFYFMVFTVTTWLFRAIHPAWLATDARHLTNFLTFLVGVLFLYRLSLRLLPKTASQLVCALFVSQPLLLGHAFINQKDVPFMVFFLASVELGLTAIDRAELRRARPAARQGQGSAAESPPSLREEWARLSQVRRMAWGACALVVALLAGDLWLTGLAREAAVDAMSHAYQGEGPAALVSLFRLVATDAYKTPLDAYRVKLEHFFFWFRLVISPFLFAAGLALWKAAFPQRYGRSAGRWIRRWGVLAAAGIVLGLATSIRLVAPFAGVLVAIYGLGRGGRRAVPALLPYAALSAATTYLTWPVLWGNPIGAFLGRASMAEGFAQSEVFFMGSRYETSNLPLFYLPTLVAIQLTIPAVVLFVLGAVFSIRRAWLDPGDRLQIGLVWLWLMIPASMVIAGLVPVYDNFRHELFMLPALFLIAGIGWEGIARLIRSWPWAFVLAVVCLIPGLAGITRLHPFEYIYYNELVGGLKGAAGEYALDYWCTSLRRAMAVVNAKADPGARVLFEGGMLSAAPFAREDLQLLDWTARGPSPDFVVRCRQWPGDTTDQPETNALYDVEVDGVVLAEVRGRPPGR